jgi:tetraacyldisaccharide 4'-kinase
VGFFGPDWSRIHQKESSGILAFVLEVFSFLYGAGVRLRLRAYRRGIFKRKSLPGFVVSIGNLTVGGTGKTPAAIMLARWAFKEGFRVALLSRGYGGRYKKGILEVSDGNSIKADPRDAGDEPYLLAKKLSGIPVVISEKRYDAGIFAHEKFGCNFFILDDGFQHLELRRELDLVLIDAERPFGNGHLLPRGPLREPVDQLARADACIITRCGMQGSGDNVLKFLENETPAIPFFYANHLPKMIDFPFLDEIHEPGILDGKKVVAFAGIARPEVFKDTLAEMGAEIVYFKGFKDHYLFKRDEIQKLIHIKEKLDARYLITTEKDWVRIASVAPAYHDMAYLCIEFKLLLDRDNFFKMVKDGIKR